MKRLICAVVVLLGCSQPQPEPPAERPTATSEAPTATSEAPTATSEAPQPAQPAEPQEPAKEVYIDAVSNTNPLVVTGRARTFENNVVLRVRDARGQLMLEDFTTSAGEMGHHNPFEAQLWLVRDPGGKVTVDAFEYSAKDGSVRSLTSKTIDYSVEPIDATLVFPTKDCTEFASFTRRIPKTQAMARLLVEALLAGPTAAEKGASSPFPKGSDVKSVILRDGTITVDFNERLQNVGGACAAQAIRESVTRTLARLPAVKRVVITAGGSESLALQP